MPTATDKHRDLSGEARPGAAKPVASTGLSRRRLLKLSLFGGVVLSGGLLLGGFGGGGYLLPAEVAAGLRCLSPRQYWVLRAAALRILDGAQPPPAQDLAAPQCAFLDGYLARLDAGMQSDVRALLELLEFYPVAGRFARFTRLAPAAQDAVLDSWQNSRLAVLRQGFQALKAMCFLAHYQDERSFASIGYSGPVVVRPPTPN